MLKLYILMAVCLGLAFMYEKIDFKTRFGISHPWFFYLPLVAILICFNGFRGSYNDTWNYRDMYTYLVEPFPQALDDFSWALGDNPAFELVQSFFKTYNVDVHLMLMFFGFWTILLYMRFIRKYNVNFVFTMYFFFTMGCYMFTLAAIKQCMAIAISLFATEFALEKKYFRFVLLVGIASLFHAFVLVFLIIPFLDFEPWSNKTYFMLILIFVAGLALQPLMGVVVDVAGSYREVYDEAELTRGGINIFRFVAGAAPVLVSFVYKEDLFKDSTRQENIFANICIVFMGIQFLGFFGTAMYFVRIANYFSLFPVVALPWMLSKINSKDGPLISMIAACCYFMFFYITESTAIGAYQALTPKAFYEILSDTLKGAL